MIISGSVMFMLPESRSLGSRRFGMTTRIPTKPYWVEVQTVAGDESTWTKRYFDTAKEAETFRKRVPKRQLGWWVID